MVASPNRRGFALADVLAGSILLAVSLAVTIGLAGRAISAQRRGDELAVAAMLADEQLELMLARGPDDYRRRHKLSGDCDKPFDRFRYDIDIDTGSESVPHFVRVMISWDSGAIERSIAVETLMSSRLGDEPDPLRQPDEPVERYQ